MRWACLFLLFMLAALAQSLTPTSITLTTQSASSTAMPDGFSQLLTFYAAVTPIIQGRVKFFDNGNFMYSVGIGTDGVATMKERLRTGAHAITASYDGDAKYAASQSNTVSVQVAR